jgi:hypothetical protein
MEPVVVADYYKNECFTVDKLPAMLQKDFYPFTKIKDRSIVKKDRKNRIVLNLEDGYGNRKNLNLLLSVEYPPVNEDGSFNKKTPPKFHINKKSFENAVEALRNLQALEKEMKKQFDLADVEVVEDDILEDA